jgi:RimJ/RimL family protein N-acetyltransferase
VIPVLETERLRIRPLREEDAGAFAELNADPRVMEHYPRVQTREESVARLAELIERGRRGGLGVWACELRGSGEWLGCLALSDWCFPERQVHGTEIGWKIAHAHWGRGYAPEGARRLLRYAFGELGLGEIIALTAERNDRSRRVMEKLGMARDPGGDFDHPKVPEGHPARRHVLYRLAAPFRG